MPIIFKSDEFEDIRVILTLKSMKTCRCNDLIVLESFKRTSLAIATMATIVRINIFNQVNVCLARLYVQSAKYLNT